MGIIRKLSIVNRIMIIIGLGLFVFVLAGILTERSLSGLGQTYSKIADENETFGRHLNKMQMSFDEIQKAYDVIIASKGQGALSQLKRLKEQKAEFDAGVEGLKESYKQSPWVVERADALSTECSALDKQGKALVLAMFSSPEGNDDKVKALVDGVKGFKDKLIEFRNNFRKANDGEVFSAIQSASTMLLTVLLFGLLVLTAFSLMIALVTRTQMSSFAQKLDECSSECSTATKRIQTAVDYAKESSSSQASSVQETAATLNQITSMVQRNEEYSRKSNEKSRLTSELAEGTGRILDEMRSAMNGISGSMEKVSGQVAENNVKFSEVVTVINNISEKTQIINDIVFQTKLLAFNASVEAARAGESGKGFAVVAEEIGKLAQLSGAASSEIEGLLAESTGQVKSVVENSTKSMEQLIDQNKTQIETGHATTERCAEALQEVLTNVREVAGMIDEISSASKEQAEGVSNINIAMNQIDEVVQKSASDAQESSESVKQLFAQVRQLEAITVDLNSIVSAGGSKGGAGSGGGKSPSVVKAKPQRRAA